jgi:acyl-CoA reductase-like NAD-dependent aldehyde dehydrogenase
MKEAGVNEGLPADAIGCMTSATIEGTEALMKHKQTAVILATGRNRTCPCCLFIGEAGIRRWTR